MEVILLERVRNLGFMGDVVVVKRGYARNYLLPQQKALRVNEENKLYFESKRKEIETRNIERKSEAERITSDFKDSFINIIRNAGDTGQLYGSVTKRDTVEALAEAGLNIEATNIILNKPIKVVGIHDVQIELYPEVFCNVKLNVAISQDAAEHQQKTGEVYGIQKEEAIVAEVAKDKKKEKKSEINTEEDPAKSEKQLNKSTDKESSTDTVGDIPKDTALDKNSS